MKKQVFIITSIIVLCCTITSCESTTEKLAGCYSDLNYATRLTVKYASEITEAWQKAETEHSYGMQDDYFDSDFENINKKTDWKSIGTHLSDSDKFLHKHFSNKYSGMQRALLRLYNKAREMRNLAKSITKDSSINDDYDDFCDDFNELFEEYLEIKQDIEDDYPEIPGSLYSIEDVLNR